MSLVKIVGIALITLGFLGLLYGGFGYTKDTHDTKIGPIELSMKDKGRVNIPVWAGVAAIVAGGAVLLVPRKSRA